MSTPRAGISVLMVAIGAGFVTVLTGSPPRLPDVALNSTVLFHLERVVALLSVSLVLVVVITRTWRGDLPDEISAQGLKYEARGITQTTTAALDFLMRENERARTEYAALHERIETLERRT
jgi:hypothetical protein